MSTQTITLTMWIKGGKSTDDLNDADFITCPKSVISDVQVFADAVSKHGFTDNISESASGKAFVAYKARKGLTIEIPA